MQTWRAARPRKQEAERRCPGKSPPLCFLWPWENRALPLRAGSAPALGTGLQEEMQRSPVMGQHGWNQKPKGVLRFRKTGEDSSPGELTEGVLRQMKEQGNSSSFGLYTQLGLSLKLSQPLYQSAPLHCRAQRSAFDGDRAQPWNIRWGPNCRVNPAWFPAWPKPVLNPGVFWNLFRNTGVRSERGSPTILVLPCCTCFLLVRK